MNNLLIDFGASRIKVGISKNNSILKTVDYNSVAPKKLDNIKYEVSVDSLKKLFDDILKDFSSYNPNSIFICSEQHGFSLLNNNNFVTDYISWKDNRAIEKIDGLSTIDFVKLNLPDFKKVTGMNIKPGIPAISLLHMMRLKNIPKNIKILSLPEIFGADKIHSTMLAGLGIWDIYKKTKYDDLFLLYKELGYEVHFNEPTYDIDVTNKINNINIYTAVGDNQCAILGSNLEKNNLIINMGTGSQIAKLDILDMNSRMEQRPYFKDEALSIITHIPSGRALNCFLSLIEDVFLYFDSKNSVWELFNNIKLSDLLNSNLNFNLSVFQSAYKFENGGNISNILENSFSLNNYLSSLLKSYIEQYFSIIDEYSIKYDKIILSGGIPKKINLIKEYIECTKKINLLINNFKEDETLYGLKILSINND